MSVLNAAHARRRACDLKPENIMIGKATTGGEPMVKLLDLGVPSCARWPAPKDRQHKFTSPVRCWAPLTTCHRSNGVSCRMMQFRN